MPIDVELCFPPKIQACLSSVPELQVELPGAGIQVIGAKEHGELTGRDKPDQHPMTAVTGLPSKLAEKLDVDSALTNQEIKDLLDLFTS